MATSKSKEFAGEDNRKQTTTGKQMKRLSDFDNAIIISTRVSKGFKRWKFLQNKVAEKQEKIERIGKSKHLELYATQLDEAVEQIKKDIPNLQSIFDGEYSNAFDRKDRKRATTGDMGKNIRDKNRYGSTKEYEHLQRRAASTDENEKDTVKEECKRMKEYEPLQSRAAWTNEKEKDAVKEECKRLQTKLEESENEKAALKISHEQEVAACKEETKQLNERLEAKVKHLNNQLDNERKAKEDALMRYKENLTKSEDVKTQLEKKIAELEANTNQLTAQLDNERKAKEDALIRLSSMASNKLRDNNPNIADLSDPNRPTKLSEQFSELYDNEWTDAFDELENALSDKGEKEIISYLRDIILEIHSVCSEVSSSRLIKIEEAFVVPFNNIKIPSEIFKIIKDCIKSMAPNLLDATKEYVCCGLEKKYKDDPVAVCLQHQNVKRYIDKCTEVCWYMSVQDPQVIMDGSKSRNETFDSTRHREYTKKGPYEDFVVWPVLYLYKGGQMLSKGVAQGMKEMKCVK